MADHFSPEHLRRLLAGIDELLDLAQAATRNRSAALERVPAEYRASADNLVQYLAVRTHDLRPLQRELADLSLSSLGRMEGHVMDTLRGVRRALLGLLGEGPARNEGRANSLSREEAEHTLRQNAVNLLGPGPSGRQTRIMVTLPTEAREDRGLLRDLLLAGMDIVRINLAHDTPAVWDAMVENLRAVGAECGRHCRIFCDLPGPKLRTGALEPGPCVLRVRPRRNPFGVVVDPVEVVFLDPGPHTTARPDGGVIPLAEPLAPQVKPGDRIVIVDTRNRRRRFRVRAVADGSCTTTVKRNAYLAPGCAVEVWREGMFVARSSIGPLPARESRIPLRVDDILVVTRAETPGHAAGSDDQGRTWLARVPCTLPEVFEDVRAGQRILFDDGQIGGVVVAQDSSELRVRITDVPPGGGKLRAEKGINLPDTELRATALTPSDLVGLDWLAAHADIVGLSFVQRAADVEQLHAELERRGRPDLGVVLKIETAAAFQRLPELLLTGLRSPPLGVMVARGDLAVEVGYARLAEVQEEILWLCEAAHVPVIWATQVLDSMARTGTPSRSEITDAAMGVRAECVMLNKGPFIAETTRFLGGLLERMQEHQTKKRSMLRRLRVAGEPELALISSGGNSGAATK